MRFIAAVESFIIRQPPRCQDQDSIGLCSYNIANSEFCILAILNS